MSWDNKKSSWGKKKPTNKRQPPQRQPQQRQSQQRQPSQPQQRQDLPNFGRQPSKPQPPQPKPKLSKPKSLRGKPKAKVETRKPGKTKASSWGSSKNKNVTGIFGSAMDMSLSAPAMAGQANQKVSRKGQVDYFDPQMERSKILHKVMNLEKRGSFPFNRHRVMPDRREIQSRLKYLKDVAKRPLHKYQEEGLAYLCSGSRRLLADGMGLGKSQDFATLIATPTKFKPAIQIEVGDKIIGQNGKPCKVLGKYIWEDIDFYKMKFHDGTSMTCCGDHQWSVMRKGRAYRIRKKKGKVEISDYKTMTTKELTKLSLVQENKKGKGKNYNYHIPCVEPVRYRKKDLPIDPYILGIYLGDGSSGNSGLNFAINENDLEVVTKISKYFNNNVNQYKQFDKEREEYKKCYIIVPYGAHKKKFINSLKKLGLYEKGSLQKFIPEMYKYGSVEQRWQLLCGLMDSDGTLNTYKGKENGGNGVSYGSSSYKLIHGTRELVLSLGGIAKIGKPEYKTYNHKGEKIRTENCSWRMGIKFSDNKVPFTSSRQLAKFTPCEKYDKVFKNIESIEYIGKRNGVCFTVDEPNNLYVAQHYIVTHNTAQALISLPSRDRGGTIVVCPSSVRLGWKGEIEAWRPDLDVVTPMKKSMFRFPEFGEIVIVGWDSLPVIAENYKSRVPLVLVCDEAHYAKSHSTSRHKKISYFMNCADVVIGLTGTPMPNNVEDLWNVLKVCGMQRLPNNEQMPLLGPRSRFGRTFFEWEKGEKRPVGCKPEIVTILKKLTFRRTARDVCKELPPITMNKIVCPVSPRFRDELDAILARAGGEEAFRMKIESAMAIHENHGEVDDHLMRLRAQIDIAKLPEIERMVMDVENEGEHLVVFSPFREIIVHLAKRRGWGTIMGGMNMYKKRAVQEGFNNGSIKWIGITTAGATGVDLPGPDGKPCVKMIRSSLDWSPATNDQVIKRIDRVAKKMAYKGGINKNHAIQIYDFYFDHRIDEIVWTVIDKKRKILEALGLKADVDKSSTADPNYFTVDRASTGYNSQIQNGGNNDRRGHR